MAILRPVFRVGQVYALALRESRVIPNALMQEHVDGPARGARFRSANPFFRDLLMTLDRLCRYSLPLAFCAENAALALRAPQDAALPCGGGASFHGSLRSRLRRPRSCSTLFYTKARPESILTRRGLCRTTPLNTALFRAGAFQLRSGPPQTVPGLPAFRLRGRFRGWRARIRFPFVPAGSPGMRLPS